MTLLNVENLSVRYAGAAMPAVNDVHLQLKRGGSLGLVGESGSGKTQTALAIMGLLPSAANVSGSVQLDGQELLGLSDRELNRVRPERIAMVFQDPLSALNPFVRIGDQLDAVLAEHKLAVERDASAVSIAMLEKVGLPDPERQHHAYPHQLSGGMRQRALIAMALLGKPELLIADEPTTALDVTVQAQILDLLLQLREEFELALLLITHDLNVVAQRCENVLVLDQGQPVEAGPVSQVFENPATERTKRLVEASRYTSTPAERGAGETVLTVDTLAVSYTQRKEKLNAVLPVGFSLAAGETLAIVGESGSGKTSLVRAVLGLATADGGSVSLFGKPLAATVSARSPALRRQMQMVFQDPQASINPAMRVAKIVAEPLAVHEPNLSAAERSKKVAAMLEHVGLAKSLSQRFPHQLSGGQAQRVAIARALIAAPRILVCDEAVSALDATVRAEVLELLRREQAQSGLSIILITHDLGVVRSLAHRVLVMYLGRVCETSATEDLFRTPRHPYSKALIESIPTANAVAPEKQETIRGEPGSVLHPPQGCVFHPRCLYAEDRCRSDTPTLTASANGEVACLRAAQLELGPADLPMGK